jgi:putative transposase
LTYRFIAEHREDCPVAWACDAMGVSESGFHAWSSRTPSALAARRELLADAIRRIHAEVKGRYGSPRMTAESNARGSDCSETTVADLMRRIGVRARSPKRFVRTTDSRHARPVATNLLARDFRPAGPNASRCADLTSVPTAEGWLYLAVVEDLFSRQIVGRSMGATMTRRLVIDALEMAVERRLPGRGWWPTPTGAARTPASTTGACWRGAAWSVA